MNKSKIEWCDSTWNPVTGCLHGCDYCYARRIAERFGQNSINEAYMVKENPKIYDLHSPVTYDRDCGHDSMGNEIDKSFIDPYPAGFAPTFHRYRLNEPTKKKKQQNIFVCSMADLFGYWVPDKWIDEVFQACFNADHHRYMFLTKNPKRYDKAVQHYEGEYNPYEYQDWDDMWFGTTINSQQDERRVVELLGCDEGHKFLSIEPLLGWVDISKYLEGHGIDWVIIGAESGPGAKPPEPEWVQSIIDQCRDAGIPIFLKNNLNWPMRIQEFPWEKENVK
jgi:protein gp37